LAPLQPIDEVDVTVPAIALTSSDRQTFPLWIRVLLIIFALNDTLAGLVDLPNIFQEYRNDTTLLQLAHVASVIRTAVTPVIAGVALYFAIVGRIRHAIVAMGILILIFWLSGLPVVAIDGLQLSGNFAGLTLALQRFLHPLLAIAAIVLAVKNRRPGLAALFVCVPDIVAWLNVLAFFLGVDMSIYGL
jgi:hypothetical protein